MEIGEVRNGRTISNQFIVSYNKYALKKYKCHINFDIVQFKEAIKYVFKYVFKKEDSARIVVKPI
jgi:hypothetical protein